MENLNTISIDSDLTLSAGEISGLCDVFLNGDIGNPNHKFTQGQRRVIEDTRRVVQQNMKAMGLW